MLIAIAGHSADNLEWDEDGDEMPLFGEQYAERVLTEPKYFVKWNR